MTFTRDLTKLRPLAAAALLLLAACGDTAADLTPLESANAALASGDGLAAEVVLRDMMANGTSRSEVAAFLGEAELLQGELVEARQWLESGEFSDDTSGHGFHMLARLEMREGNLPAAGDAFDKSLAVERKNAELWVDIGRLRYRGGEQSQAVEASIYAVELDPENGAALQFRAQLLRDSEGMAAAIPWFERALERNPDDVGLLADYAATLGELGRARDMLVTIRKIARIDPANRRIFYLQAVLAARAGMFQLAQSLLARSSKADRDMPAAMLLAGIIDIENGNYASAAQVLERLASAQPDNRRVRQLLARALSLGGNDRELVYRYGEIASRPSASPYLRTLVGRSHEALDQRDQAAQYLDTAAKRRSGNLVAVQSGTTLDVAEARGPSTGFDALALVRARIFNGNPEAARTAAGGFLERFPGSSDALSLAGDASLTARRFEEALDHYNKAAAIRGPWVLTRKRVKTLLALGRQDDALAALASHLVGDPGNAEAAGLLAVAAALRADWPNAAIFADHAIANGRARDPLMLSLRSEIALRLGQVDLGIGMAERAYAIQPMSKDATRALAIAYRQREDGEALAAVLEAKLNRMPD
ncbi:tetratricopeptide repeat protein [Pontixanthobacter sp. CEM42]|uniref:tetratricopeptide repeat protein n=1 Tax=Pontixanthobacter sp. CEM42 TaxID=2792077 RepID=UPI001AE08BB7|nr:tetratricopeptide repeat protein [Pontixanthobacter sp. CEM42]